MNAAELIEDRLLRLTREIETQADVGRGFAPNVATFDQQLAFVREYIDVAGEYGLAYELLVALLEGHSFKITSSAAVGLLEVGLLLGYKTERPEDADFDWKRKTGQR